MAYLDNATPRNENNPCLLPAEGMTRSSTGGMKEDKPERFDQIPVGALRELARLFGWGNAKYPSSDGVDNWRKGYAWSKSYSACMRHLTAFWGGENNDPESGISHLIHAAWHCMVLFTWRSCGSMAQFDDRQDKSMKGAKG